MVMANRRKLAFGTPTPATAEDMINSAGGSRRRGRPPSSLLLRLAPVDKPSGRIANLVQRCRYFARRGLGLQPEPDSHRRPVCPRRSLSGGDGRAVMPWLEEIRRRSG
jgi:hypothetical protein